MKKKLKSLSVTGTKEFPELNYIIDFSEDFQEDNIYVITGPNGYGKTMCLDVISHALSRENNLPYTQCLKKACLNFDNDDYIKFDLKNDDDILKYSWNNKRKFIKTTQMSVGAEIPEAVCVLEHELEPELSYIFNPPADMEDNFIKKINNWFNCLDVPALCLESDKHGEPEFQIRNRTLTEKDIKYLGSGEREILILLNALLTLIYENKDILLYDELGIHMHIAVQPMLLRFIADLKPENAICICTTHSVKLFGTLNSNTSDLYTLNTKWKDDEQIKEE